VLASRLSSSVHFFHLSTLRHLFHLSQLIIFYHSYLFFLPDQRRRNKYKINTPKSYPLCQLSTSFILFNQPTLVIMTDTSSSSSSTAVRGPLIGVLALQGAFEEHQACLEKVGCRTVQVRTIAQLQGLDGIVLPGGESTAMGLIGTATTAITATTAATSTTTTTAAKPVGIITMWDALKEFSSHKPTWGTCAGMILLAEQCVGASAVIENGQSLIGGMDILVCRNYFGSQVSSFELPTTPPPPPLLSASSTTTTTTTTLSDESSLSFPGVFIRAPAILSAGPGVQVLGKVVATPCRQAAVVLQELERKLALGETVIQMGVVDALERTSNQDIQYKKVGVVVKQPPQPNMDDKKIDEETMEDAKMTSTTTTSTNTLLELPGAADGTNARQVISAVRKGHILCTAFHPELTEDYRWHDYFATMVRESKNN
jgi:pyridoxal 5'-phosphate synthase pdxT subunit